MGKVFIVLGRVRLFAELGIGVHDKCFDGADDGEDEMLGQS